MLLSVCSNHVAPHEYNQLSTNEGGVQFVCPFMSYRSRSVLLNSDRYSLVASQPSFLHLSATLVNFRNACIHMNIIHSFVCFGKQKQNKRKSNDKENFKPANMPVKTLNAQNSSVQNKKTANINRYDSELIRKHSNNGVQTKTATSTLKEKEEKKKSFYTFVYTYTRLASPFF